MFPSSGYFRGLDCPFYASGLCERPYCHYKHSKQPPTDKDSSWIGKNVSSQRFCNVAEEPKVVDIEKQKKSLVANELERSKNLKNQFAESNPIVKDLSKLYVYNPQASIPGLYESSTDGNTDGKYKNYAKYCVNGTPAYQPTCDKRPKETPYDVFAQSKKKEKVKEYSCDGAVNSAPEYNPTPISKLKRMQKYSSQSNTHSVLEYDPVSNFEAGFGNKTYLNLDNPYIATTNNKVQAPSKDQVYKPSSVRPLASDEEDEDHELVIDAKFSDDSEDGVVDTTIYLSDEQHSDNESESRTTTGVVKSSLYKSSNSINPTDIRSNQPVHNQTPKHTSSVSHKSINSNKTSSDSSHSKTSKSSKGSVDLSANQSKDEKKKSESSSSGSSNSSSSNSSSKSKLEKKKSSDDKSAKEKKKAESGSKSSEKKATNSSDSNGSSSLKETSCSKKEKKDVHLKEKHVGEKMKKPKDHHSLNSKNCQSGEQIEKEKDRHKGEVEKVGNVKVKLKEGRCEEVRRSNSLSSSSLLSSSSSSSSTLSVKKGNEPERRKSDPLYKSDSSKHEFNADQKKEHVRRKSESEKKSDGKSHQLELVKRKSESEMRKTEHERRKETSLHKTDADLKRKEDKKIVQNHNTTEKNRVEKIKPKKEVNVEKSCDKEKMKKLKSKTLEINKKSVSQTSVKTEGVHSSSPEKSKKRVLSGEKSLESNKKRHCSEKHLSSSSDENHSSKKIFTSDMASKSVKRKAPIEGQSKSSSIFSSSSSNCKLPLKKPKNSYSVSIYDLFGKDSDEEEEGSSNTLNQSAGDESTGLSDDDELNVIFGDTDLSENDPYEECLKIFNESNNEKRQSNPIKNEKKKREVVRPPPSMDDGKKRVAHAAAANRQCNDKLKKLVRPVIAKPSPAQVMQNRILEMQKRSANPMLRKDKPVIGKSLLKVVLPKLQLKLPDMSMPESCNINVFRTVAGTAAKTQSRVAHVPKKEVLKRPTITPDSSSKVPVAIRQRYLNLIIDEYVKLIDSEWEAMKKGEEEEKDVYRSCNTKVGYLNKAIHLIKRLRSGCLGTLKKLLPSTNPPPAPCKETKKLEHQLTGVALYERVKQYILTEEELRENHFPRPEGLGRSKYYISDVTKEPYLPSDERFCCRCGKTYRVTSSGRAAVEDECLYHWAKPVRRRYGNTIETRYRCCQAEVGSTGCEVGGTHVHHKNKFDGSSGYMITPDREMPPEGPGVFAMDCEMLYTTAGMEVARVTVVDSECNVVYETLVKPDHEILDYNTRFSGITEEDMKGVATKLIHVQAVLLHYFSSQAILVGHSLENDLMSVKLIHSCVVDTSVLYPHRAGRPLKRALKNLTHDYLNTTIQEGIDGHDSQEDAIAAMRLVHYKIQQDGNKYRS
ncbi:RNA exonuclease 1 homolog [Octopus vulgaris]|uniref:RNA exonuclease 1 homolog n=1 Tax=Octopus vulgaris TaxID=6645 RepID=A0AA36BSF6_OCTVU|nr:RNA exonuclease 1 homolog [Octopus vulgaris]